jgi:myo-inositol-1(or 4)-monophosphatase
MSLAFASSQATDAELIQLAEEAARAAGGLMRANFGRFLRVASAEDHDIKIELDRRSQDLIEHHLLTKFPGFAVYGEEGIRGDKDSPDQWIIDPIDGTVNFFYGIPHFCVSIALRRAGELRLGVIYDPMREECWTVLKGGAALLNGHPVHVSQRTDLAEAVITVGLAKTADSIEKGMNNFQRLVRTVKKCRMMGSAALDVAYVSCGRLDAYIESQISLWDIAAGILLVEAAGGSVRLTPHESVPDKFTAVISSGHIDFGV